MTLFDGIRQNNFVVVGRAGMDFFPHPPGRRTEAVSYTHLTLPTKA